ncbi:hypothetical protein P9J64_17060 [Deltaproteobacteria bacterium IMCC39524]|nr:hypothetical protein [Deltaproteobacteria bacterium IMCC39524]
MSKKSKSGGLLGAVLFICILLILFVDAPGMLVIGFIKTKYLPTLDVSQIWVFSIIVSFAFFGLVTLITRDLRLGFTWYMGMCTLCVAICAVLYFGFKIGFPEVYLEYFFDGSSYIPVK